MMKLQLFFNLLLLGSVRGFQENAFDSKSTELGALTTHRFLDEHAPEDRGDEGRYDCVCTEGIAYCSNADDLVSCHCDGSYLHCIDNDEDLRGNGDKPWGAVIGASLIINLSTLAGVFFVGGHWVRKRVRKSLFPQWNADADVGTLWTESIIPMFACGALMATTFFLLMPEALNLIQTKYGPEPASTWRFGSSVMGGFLIPVFLHMFFPHSHRHTHVFEPSEELSEDKETGSDEETNKRSEATSETDDEYVKVCGCIQMKNVPLFVSLNLGEVLHNFTDGIFVGAAYYGCGASFGNSVMVASLLHEIPNQLAGYLVMVNQNGINPVLALVINFFFGLSVLVGALLILLVEFNNVAIGCIFGLGGGIFLHVAISEMLGSAERHRKKKIHFVYMLLAFLVGSIPIGLVLLNHEHCGGH